MNGIYLSLVFILASFVIIVAALEIRRTNRRLAKLKIKIAYHEKAIELIGQGRGAEVPPIGTHPDEMMNLT